MEDCWGDLPHVCKEHIMRYVVAEKKVEVYDDMVMLTSIFPKSERERIQKEWVTERMKRKQEAWRVLHRHMVRHE